MLLIVVILFVSPIFIACNEESEEYTNKASSISVYNEFTLTKYCIGQTINDAIKKAEDEGYILKQKDFQQSNRYLSKTENGITKVLYIYTEDTLTKPLISNATLSVSSNSFQIAKEIFKQWINEFKDATDFTLITHQTYQTNSDKGNSKQYSNLESMLTSIDEIQFNKYLSMVVSCVDKFAFQYNITFNIGISNTVHLQILNSNINNQNNDDWQNGDSLTGMNNEILTMKVDYLTFNYEGYTTQHISNQIHDTDTIPFLAHYVPACDFGQIKLYYNDTNNMLFYGDIIWMGCGELFHPNKFNKGLCNKMYLPYPGINKIGLINEQGAYIQIQNEQILQQIWNTVSKQEEFQRFYLNSKKRIAVYLYTPSVGVGNPAEWDFIVFVEK